MITTNICLKKKSNYPTNSLWPTVLCIPLVFLVFSTGAFGRSAKTLITSNKNWRKELLLACQACFDFVLRVILRRLRINVSATCTSLQRLSDSTNCDLPHFFPSSFFYVSGKRRNLIRMIKVLLSNRDESTPSLQSYIYATLRASA